MPTSSAPDFTIGSGGILATTVLDQSANTTNNVFEITTPAGFGDASMTLPTPASNTGRIIIIKKVGGATNLIFSNSFGSHTLNNNAAAIFISDGTGWIATNSL